MLNKDFFEMTICTIKGSSYASTKVSFFINNTKQTLQLLIKNHSPLAPYYNFSTDFEF